MSFKNKAIEALEAYRGQYKGLSASVVAGCIQVIRELPEEDILRGEELAKVACAIELLKDYQNIGAADHLRELVQAEKDGRLVVLPCKVGDTVYLTDHDGVVEAEVTCIRPFVFQNEIEFRGNAAWRFEDPFHHDGRILEQDVFIVFGKDAFLTRKEAEAALKGDPDAES